MFQTTNQFLHVDHVFFFAEPGDAPPGPRDFMWDGPAKSEKNHQFWMVERL